jgi:hypothetical protein
MKRFYACLFPAVLVLHLCTSASARADFIPWSSASAVAPSWSYAASPNPKIIAADHNGTGGIALTKSSLTQERGNHRIILTTLTPFSSAVSSTPDHITRRAYHLTLFLKDNASRQSTNLIFTGIFNGTLSAGGANLSNIFTGRKTQQVHLGHFWYTVTIGPYQAPVGNQVGSISAQVSVRHNPEPPSLVLAGLGLGGLALVGFRKRRHRRRATINWSA